METRVKYNNEPIGQRGSLNAPTVAEGLKTNSAPLRPYIIQFIGR